MKQTNKNKSQAKTNKKPQNKTKEGHLLLFYKLSVKQALCPRLSGKADLHWTNDTYRNGIFTLFNLSPLHTLSSFSQFILSCAVFSLSHPCFPPASFPFSPEGFLYFFKLSSPSPCSQKSMAGKDFKTMDHICWRLQSFVEITRFAFWCH